MVYANSRGIVIIYEISVWAVVTRIIVYQVLRISGIIRNDVEENLSAGNAVDGIKVHGIKVPNEINDKALQRSISSDS